MQFRPEAYSEVYEYRSWMRGCHTDNLASSRLCPEACLQLASTVLWTQAGLDIVNDSCCHMGRDTTTYITTVWNRK